MACIQLLTAERKQKNVLRRAAASACSCAVARRNHSTKCLIPGSLGNCSTILMFVRPVLPRAISPIAELVYRVRSPCRLCFLIPLAGLGHVLSSDPPPPTAAKYSPTETTATPNRVAISSVGVPPWLITQAAMIGPLAFDSSAGPAIAPDMEP